MLLADFISCVNSMATGGINLKVNHTDAVVEGCFIIAPCDTPAANWLGGFKEGVGFAYKACRRCTASTLFLETDFKLREEAEHRERCNQLHNLSHAAKVYWSKMWGINSQSCLMSIEGFPVCSGLVQDPMHLLLEGLVPYELKYMLFLSPLFINILP